MSTFNSHVSDERTISVIGLGRVGLPLALSFADRGATVLGIDHDTAILDSIRARRMPFVEADTQELLERVYDSGRLELSERAADAARAEDIVITIGTPSFSHLESDLSQVRAAAAAGPRPDSSLDDRAGDDRFRRRIP
jgi:UDP-N-acetyl-D-mannosaminuronic acid dehydrogenase